MEKEALQECINMADVFYEVGKEWGSFKKLLSDSNSIYIAAVNLAFSCELYIKALLGFRGKKPEKVHSLSALFNELPENDKTEIKKYYSPINSSISFEFILEEHDKAFENWRYAFEKKENELVYWSDFLGVVLAFKLYVSGIIDDN